MYTRTEPRKTFPKDPPIVLDELLVAIWELSASQFRLPKDARFGALERRTLQVLTANIGYAFSLHDIAVAAEINPSNLTREKMDKLKTKLKAYNEARQNHSHCMALYLDGDEWIPFLKGQSTTKKKQRGYGLYLFKKDGTFVPPVPPIQNRSKLLKWRGSPEQRDIQICWRADKTALGYAVALEDVGVFLRCDMPYTYPGELEHRRGELNGIFLAKYAGKETSNNPVIRIENPFEQGLGSTRFDAIARPAKYFDFGDTNKVMYEPILTVEDEVRTVWDYLGNSPQQALLKTCNPLALNIIITVEDKFVINLRGNSAAENWNTLGPSLSGTINADPTTGYLLTDLTKDEHARVVSRGVDVAGVKRVDLRGYAVKMASKELGKPVGEAIERADILVTGYGMGLLHGTGAILAHCTLDMTMAAVKDSLLNYSNRWETSGVDFWARAIHECHTRLTPASIGHRERVPRVLPFLDIGLMMAFYQEEGPSLLEPQQNEG